MPAHRSRPGMASASRARLLILSAMACTCTVVSGTTSVSSTASMTIGRASAPAVMLDGDRVLVIGGAEGPSSEIYDPALDVFVSGPGLSEVRMRAAAVRLNDGRVLVVGGSNAIDAALETAEIYDPATGEFSVVSMSAARSAATATLLSDGRVLIVGGSDGHVPLATAEIFDPATNAFSLAGELPIASVTAAAVLANGTVLIAGGQIGDGTASAAAHLYDPITHASETTGSLSTARRGHTMTMLADGRVLVAGGVDTAGVAVASAEIYDPARGQFFSAGTLFEARVNHIALPLATGEVLIAGGRNDTGPLASAELFNPVTATFAAARALSEARADLSAAVLADGRVLVAGGTGFDAQPLASAEVIQPVADGTPLPTATLLTADPGSSVYGQAVHYTATVTGGRELEGGSVRFLYDGTLLLGSAPLDATGVATLTTALTPAGTRSITAEFEGSNAAFGSTSPPHTQSVARSSTSSSLAVSPLMQAYTDVETLEASISGAHGEAPARDATFKVGTQQMNAEPVPFEHAGGGVWKATLTVPLIEKVTGALKPSGIKVATVALNEVSPNYTVTTPTAKAFQINREDARAMYDGPRSVTTSSKGSSTATIPLRAVIRDIAVTSEGGNDKTVGDIRLAMVTFINRATYQAIATVAVSLPDASDPGTGVATYDWPVNIGNSRSKSFTVGIIVSNYYQRNSVSDDATIIVSKAR